MARISVFLTDEVVLMATYGLKKLGRSGLVARKLQVIIAAKKHGITKTADFYAITKKTLIQWIKDLKQESIKSLEVQAGRGRKPLINEDQEAEIKKWISENCNITINQLRLMILDKMSISLSSATVYRVLKKIEIFLYYSSPKTLQTR